MDGLLRAVGAADLHVLVVVLAHGDSVTSGAGWVGCWQVTRERLAGLVDAHRVLHPVKLQ